ncbi:MAG: hypothetical protein U0736_21250 [Gemmataceae bacterium]
MHIEQAIYGCQDGGYRFVGESPGFADSGLNDEARRICAAFGERPAGVACPVAEFAQPLGPRHVAVVQVADQGRDDLGRPGALAFRLLVLPYALYAALDADPFRVSDAFPPDWSARGVLPTLTWDAGPPPRRTVTEVRAVLDVEHERTALLLGGVQLLVDGGRLVLVRAAPAPELIRHLWTLLPSSTRLEVWPATFAFGNKLRFHLLAVPAATGDDYPGYVTEEAAGDYPAGRYEYALQEAAEQNDQAEIDGLFARRSRRQTIRLAAALLVGFVVIAFLLRSPLFTGAPPAPVPPPAAPKGDEAAPNLPPASEFAPLDRGERERLAARLRELAGRLGAVPPAGDDEAGLAAAVAALDRRIDERLAAKKPPRRIAAVAEYGPAKRRLRALVWKHGDPAYADPALNPVELVEHLEARLTAEGALPEKRGD